MQGQNSRASLQTPTAREWHPASQETRDCHGAWWHQLASCWRMASMEKAAHKSQTPGEAHLHGGEAVPCSHKVLSSSKQLRVRVVSEVVSLTLLPQGTASSWRTMVLRMPGCRLQAGSLGQEQRTRRKWRTEYYWPTPHETGKFSEVLPFKWTLHLDCLQKFKKNKTKTAL